MEKRKPSFTPLKTVETIIDELSNLTEKQYRAAGRYARQKRARGFGWTNWYANRGRLSLDPTKSELRRVSWRRAH